jgi:hypothetical protein
LASNLYIRFIGKIYPTQFFTDRDKAIEWLEKQYKEEMVAKN